MGVADVDGGDVVVELVGVGAADVVGVVAVRADAAGLGKIHPGKAAVGEQARALALQAPSLVCEICA